MPTTTTTKKPAATKTTAAKKTTPAKKATAGRPSMAVDLAPTDHDVPLLGGPGAGMAHLADLPLADIAPHPQNVRHDVDDLVELADSMRSLGVLERLIVVPTPRDDQGGAIAGEPYLLIAGHRRLAAAGLAGLPAVPVEIRYDLDTLERQVEAMLVENIHRKDLTPVEEGEAYQTLLDLGSLDEDGIAGATGRSLATVRRRLRLANAPVAVRDKVHAGTATLADVDALDEFADYPDLMKEAAAALGTHDFKWALSRMRQRKETAARNAAELQRMVDAGVTLMTDEELPDGWTRWNTDHLPRPIAGIVWPTLDDRDAHHRTCEHAVYLVDRHEEACTRPDVHRKDQPRGIEDRHLPGDAPTAAATVPYDAEQAHADAEKRQAEQAAWVEAAQAALATRRDYVTELLTQGINAQQADHITHALALLCLDVTEIFTSEDEATRVARRVGHDATACGHVEEHGDWEQAIDLARDALTGAKPARAALAMLEAASTDSGGPEVAWSYPRALYETDVAWWRLLQRLGYTLSTWEEDLLTAAEEQLATDRTRRDQQLAEDVKATTEQDPEGES